MIRLNRWLLLGAGLLFVSGCGKFTDFQPTMGDYLKEDGSGEVGLNSLADPNGNSHSGCTNVSNGRTSDRITPNGDPCRVDLLDPMHMAQGLVTTEALICGTINRNYVFQLDFADINNNCFHADLSGVKMIACPGGARFPVLPDGKLPLPHDSSFDWAAANAVCGYTQGDTAECGAPYGGSVATLCGTGRGDLYHTITILDLPSATDVGQRPPQLPAPSPVQPGTPPSWPSPHVPPPVPQPSVDQPTPPLPQPLPPTPGTPDPGTKVGGRIGLPVTDLACDREALRKQNDLGLLYGMPMDVVCQTRGLMFYTEASYRSSTTGLCYRADLKGTSVIPCTSELPVLNAGVSLPFDALPDPYTVSDDFATAAHLKCYFTNSVDASQLNYGMGFEAMCGRFHNANR